MGFRCEKCYVIAGSEEFPLGQTKELRRSRAEVLLKKCAQCLIDCNVGWQLDTSRCATLTSFLDIQTVSSSDLPAPGLLFTNSISGCKLLMLYEPDNYGTKDYNDSATFKCRSNYHSGLCISIIPSGSTSVFGDPSTSSFYPNDATRVCGTYYRSGSGSNYAPAAKLPVDGTYYYYYIFASPDCVAIGANHSTEEIPWRPAVPIYSTGKIFGKLIHEEDNTPQAKYGTMIFRTEISSSQYEQWAGVINWNVSALASSGTAYNIFGKSTPLNSNPCSICFTNAAGEWLNTFNNSTQLKFYFPISWLVPSPNMNSISNTLAWSAFAVAVTSTDLSVNGVIQGNGFKGFLDTDYYRAVANGPAGWVWNGGRFLTPEENVGIAIGWDPLNY